MNLPNVSSSEDFKEKNAMLNIRLEVIAEVNKALVGIVDRQSVFDLITQKLAPSVKMSFPSIWLYDSKSETIRLASHSIPEAIRIIAEKAIGKPINQISFSKKNPKERDSVYFKVIDTKKPFSNDNLYIHTYPFLPESVAKILEKVSGMKLAVSVPIIIKDEAIGVLSAIWKEPELSKENELTLSTFANQISTAIYNAQLFNQVQNQISLLQNKNNDLQSLFYLTSRISQTLDPLKVAQNAVDSLPQNENMIGAILSLYDDTTSIIRVTAITTNEFSHQASNIVGEFTKFKIHINDPQAQNNPTVLTIKKGQPHFSDSLGPALSPPLPAKLVPIMEKFLNISSTVDYPIFSRGKVVGTVSFFLRGKKFSELDENQRQLLNTYTTQIGIALENALLFTRAQEIQRNLQDALDQLNEARRRERDMIDVMGHELRTPISIVRNALAVLDADFRKTGSIARDRLTKYLDIGLESVRREITLIETLLSATKIDSHKIQLTLTKVDMADVVRDALEAEQYRATGKGLRIVLNAPRKPLLAFADRIRTQEIVDNLLSNAIKYTEKGTITINMSMEGDNAYLEVVDTGIGVSPEDIAHLGKKFFRAKQFQSEYGLRPSGTGLGLFVAFELVRIMGGKKVIKSTPGQGSTFAFYLPLYQGQADKHVEEGFMPG